MDGFLEAARALDEERVLSYFAAAAQLDFAGTVQLTGRPEVEAFVETVRHNFAAIGVPGLVFRPLRHVTAGSTSFVEWECIRQAAGGAPLFRGAFVATWDEDGCIRNLSVYTDPEAVRRVSIGFAARASAEALN